MDVIQTRHLEGVNHWLNGRAFEAVIARVPDEAVPGNVGTILADQFDQLCIPPHLCGSGCRLGQRLQANPKWGELITQLAYELQLVCGSFAGSRIARAHEEPGTWSVVLGCREFAVAEACVHAALQMCGWLRLGEAYDLAGIYERLVDLSREVCLGGGTGPIVAAARRLGVPYFRLDQESLVQLGEGVYQCRVCAATTSRTGHIAVQVSNDKDLVKSLWWRMGIPVPPGRSVSDEEAAVTAAQELGWPLVVKPRDADLGKGVSLNLSTTEQVRTAYDHALAFSKCGAVLVERHLHGMSHRLLVVKDRLVAAVLREPPTVVGDGEHTVRELVAQANHDLRRGDDYRWPLRRLRLEDHELRVLAEAGFTADSVLAPGERVCLRRDLYTWSGTVNRDVCELVHAETRDLAREAVRIVGLDVAGLDLIAKDISRPLAEQGGGFLEINAEPAAYLHLAPICERPRPVGEAIVASLFPAQSRGRVPLVIAIGERLASGAGRLTAHLLKTTGRQVATSFPDRTEWNNRRLVPHGSSLPDRLHTVMLHPQVDAAVLTAPLTDVVSSGMGTDRCHVLVLAEGQAEWETGRGEPYEWAPLIRNLVAAAGRCVVNIDDPFWERYMNGRCSSILMVSSNPAHPRLLEHLGEGHMAAFPRGREIVVRAGATELMCFTQASLFTAGDSIASVAARCLAASAYFSLCHVGSE